MQDQSPYGVTEKDLKELKSLNKINQALKELGSYVNEAEPADGYHNEVDNAYKLLQEVINNGINS
jgi:hypothetical protein